MRRIFLFLLLTGVCAPAFGTTWYVNPTTGGTRYSATNTSGQCNGQSSTPYVSGTNQPCPFYDFRLLWNDPTVSNSAIWVISGGDTVMVSGYEASTGLVGAISGFMGTPTNFCPGLSACYMPSIPSGTSGTHTRILGANYASCGTNLIGGDQTKVENMVVTDSSGFLAIAVNNSQYVDIECLNVNGSGGAGSLGVFTGNSLNPRNTANVELNNMTLQGFGNAGISGPVAGLFTVTDTLLTMNASSDWNMDDGAADPSAGYLVLSYVGMTWGGCLEEWPIVHTIPVANGGCRDDTHAGYGDCFGTPPTHLDVTLDHGLFAYCTQDGFDLTHVSASSVTVTNSIFYGNMGGNIKVGAEQTITEYNNTVVGNCQRMSAPITGAQTGFNTNLGDFCRAAGDQNAASYVSNEEYLGNASASGTAVTGTDTHFTTQTTVGSEIAPALFPYSTYGHITIVSIADDLHVTVSAPYPTNWSDHLLLIVAPPASTSTMTFYHNSDVGYGQTVLPGGCGVGLLAPSGFVNVSADESYCPGRTIIYENNINIGILNTVCSGNPGCGPTVPGMWAGFVPTTEDYNLFFNFQSNSGLCVGAHEICSSDAGFVSQPSNTITAESQLDNYNFNLSGSSVAIAAGVTIAGQTVDQAGNGWLSPPSMGAFQFGGSPTASAPTFSPPSGTYTGTQTVTLSTATGGCGSFIVWNTTNTQSGGNLTGTSSTNPLSVATTETVYAQVQSCSGFLNSAIANAPYTINPPTSGPTILQGITASSIIVQ